MEEVKIRLLAEPDAKDYWQVRLRSLKEDPEAFQSSFEEQQFVPLETITQRFRDRWTLPNSFILGAFKDSQLVGTLGFFQRKRGKIKHRGMIWGMYVLPEYRRQGVGRALLTNLIDQVKDMPGIEQLNLSVITSQAPARNLYTSLGFEPYGVQKGALKHGDLYLDEEHLVLYLSRS